MNPAPSCPTPQQLSTAGRRVKTYMTLHLGKEGGLSKVAVLLEIEIKSVLVTSMLLTV